MLVSARLLVLRVRGSQLSFFLLNAILTNSIISLDRFSASQVALVVKNLPTNAGDVSGMGSVPGSGRSPGEGHGNPLQYPCLENPTDRGAWREHGVSKSQTRLSDFHFQGIWENCSGGNSGSPVRKGKCSCDLN